MFDLDGRIIDAESSHRPSPVKQKRGDKPKRKRGTRQQPRNANKQDTPPLQLTLEPQPYSSKTKTPIWSICYRPFEIPVSLRKGVLWLWWGADETSWLRDKSPK